MTQRCCTDVQIRDGTDTDTGDLKRQNVIQIEVKGKMKRILGNDRFLMFLCRDIRRRWMQYGENRKYDLKPKKNYTQCKLCPAQATEWDHIEPVGSRPYTLDDVPAYIKRMLYNECQPLCQKCNSKKGVKRA